MLQHSSAMESHIDAALTSETVGYFNDAKSMTEGEVGNVSIAPNSQESADIMASWAKRKQALDTAFDESEDQSIPVEGDSGILWTPAPMYPYNVV
jgi:hypothetical protein